MNYSIKQIGRAACVAAITLVAAIGAPSALSVFRSTRALSEPQHSLLHSSFARNLARESGGMGNGGRVTTYMFKRRAARIADRVFENREELLEVFRQLGLDAYSLRQSVQQVAVSTVTTPAPIKPGDTMAQVVELAGTGADSRVLVHTENYQPIVDSDPKSADAWAIHPYLLAIGLSDQDLALSLRLIELLESTVR